MAENAGQTSFNRKKKILFHYKIIASFIAGTIRKLYIITSLFLITSINSNFGP
jgi:hypothetical protein